MRFLIYASLIIITGCSSSIRTYMIEGAETQFCVPEERVTPDVPWVPKNDPLYPSDGFAFRGCLYTKENNIGCTNELKNISGGVVDSKKKYPGWSWQDWNKETLIAKLAVPENMILEKKSNNEYIVIEDSSVDWNWYVWKKNSKSKEGALELMDGDELIAICDNYGIHQSSYFIGKRITCDRYVLGKDYSLKYTFESDGRVPSNVEQLDKDMFAQIDRWRCNK